MLLTPGNEKATTLEKLPWLRRGWGGRMVPYMMMLLFLQNDRSTFKKNQKAQTRFAVIWVHLMVSVWGTHLSFWESCLEHTTACERAVFELPGWKQKLMWSRTGAQTCVCISYGFIVSKELIWYTLVTKHNNGNFTIWRCSYLKDFNGLVHQSVLKVERDSN